jgi:hypothetical protein
MHLYNAAFIISQEDTTKFNQIRSKNMICYFENNELHRIWARGNGQTVYYPKDSKEIIGVNKAECSDLMIYVKEGDVDKISFLTKPEATLYPLDQAPENEIVLQGFSWLDKIRPKTKHDIFD